jgi:L-iditol 2-dehydrogenase
VSEPLEFRANVAKKLGADHVLNPKQIDTVEAVKKLTDGRGSDLVIDAVGYGETIAQSISHARKGGAVLMFGDPYPGEIFSYETSKIFRREINIITSYSTTEFETNMSLSMMKNRKVDVKEFITHKFKLDDIVEALNFATTSRNKFIKIIVAP